MAVQELLHKYAPDLKPGDIIVTPSGVTGPDLHLSPAARQTYQFVIECKNVEKLNVWEAFQQAENHGASAPGMVPVLFFKRNNSKLMVALDAEEFIKMVR